MYVFICRLVSKSVTLIKDSAQISSLYHIWYFPSFVDIHIDFQIDLSNNNAI